MFKITQQRVKNKVRSFTDKLIQEQHIEMYEVTTYSFLSLKLLIKYKLIKSNI